MDETRELEQWRFEHLQENRMPENLARRLVHIADIGHRAEELILGGCDVVTAFDIIADEMSFTATEED